MSTANAIIATGLERQIPSPPAENFIRTPVADHDDKWLGHRMEQEVVTVG
ncbi:MAG: hypothetical protein J0G35_09195 [Acidobacteriales bacterium]|nr:hypothetical protein [Terriglobales bacterium]